ncbi:MAG: hypothetical protein NT169_14815 [Chloroflexi bacterium]|nr:hypothetical protein [Chloroflexota bacterium]
MPVVLRFVIPDLGAVRRFAGRLHAKGKAWRGEAFGWLAEYNPARPEPPLDSRMNFTPADFCIGESGIWFFSLMWEHGDTVVPAEFLDDRNILGTYRSRGARMHTGEDELREHQDAMRPGAPSRQRHPVTYGEPSGHAVIIRENRES